MRQIGHPITMQDANKGEQDTKRHNTSRHELHESLCTQKAHTECVFRTSDWKQNRDSQDCDCETKLGNIEDPLYTCIKAYLKNSLICV